MTVPVAPEVSTRTPFDEVHRAVDPGHDVLPVRVGPPAADAARVAVHHPSPGSVVLEVAGEIDLVTVGALAECLLALVELPRCHEMLVDLSEITFLGAVGVGAFAQAHARATERAMALRLVSVSRIARRALVVTGATGCFDTWPSRHCRVPTTRNDTTAVC